MLRIFFVEMPQAIVMPTANQKRTSYVSAGQQTLNYLADGDKYSAFITIFMNNIKGCIINIAGGAFMGLGTLLNLAYNGFFSADMFAFSHKHGLDLATIVKVTLPHSFELIGFWLSGGIGFYIAWCIVQFMRGINLFCTKMYTLIGIACALVLIIILTAAYVEAYISTSIAIE